MAVTGVNRNAQCIVHHDRPATARCATCHKPICAECTVSTEEGKFCSHECATRAADFRKRFKTVKQGGGAIAKLFRAIFWVAVIIIILGIVNKYVKPIPVLKPYLDKLPVLGAGSSQSPAPVAPQTPTTTLPPLQL